MISYTQKEKYIQVRWKKTEIGRIYQELLGYYYSPRGCQGQLHSEGFTELQDLKNWLEGGV